jgi:hypothetical protein
MVNGVLYVKRGSASACCTKPGDRQPKSKTKRQSHPDISFETGIACHASACGRALNTEFFAFLTFFCPTRVAAICEQNHAKHTMLTAHNLGKDNTCTAELLWALETDELL